MEFTDVLTIVGMLVTGAGTLWGVAKWLVDRMDAHAEDCHKRISAMTKQADFERHLEQTERTFTEMRRDIKDSQQNFTNAINQLGTTLTARLDNIMLLLGKGNGT